MSTRVFWIVSSGTPAHRSFGTNTVTTEVYPAPPFAFELLLGREVRGQEYVVFEPRINDRHDEALDPGYDCAMSLWRALASYAPGDPGRPAFTMGVVLLVTLPLLAGQLPPGLREQAEQGDAVAQTELGSRYYSGRGVPEDDAEATRWIRMAAEQGHAPAQYDLGLLYFRSRGVRGDDTAAAWYRRAAEQGYAPAQGASATCSRTEPESRKTMSSPICGSSWP